MSKETKILHLCFPHTGERRQMSFAGQEMKAVILAYHYVMENGAVITNFENFEDWEIKLLEDSKAPTGDSLVARKCCEKDAPESGCA